MHHLEPMKAQVEQFLHVLITSTPQKIYKVPKTLISNFLQKLMGCLTFSVF